MFDGEITNRQSKLQRSKYSGCDIVSHIYVLSTTSPMFQAKAKLEKDLFFLKVLSCIHVTRICFVYHLVAEDTLLNCDHVLSLVLSLV